jgi:hypothetical protein
MKKLGFFALALSLSALLLSAPALANNDKANDKASTVTPQDPPPISDACLPPYKDYFEEKDQDKRYAKAKTFLSQCSKEDDYWLKGPRAFVKRIDLIKVNTKCADADKAFFGAPNEANLLGFMSACDTWIAQAPNPDMYYSTRIALGSGFGVLAGFYKDTARGNSYTEKALQNVSQTATPKDWTEATWATFRKDNTARLIQYKGLYKLRQAQPDYPGAIKDFSDAAAIKDGAAIKDPNTYLLRAEAITESLYKKYDGEYNALTEDEKRGEKGKAALANIYPVVARLANDYARVMAVTEGQAIYKAIYDDSKIQSEEFYKFLKNGKTTGIEELFKRFKADIGASDLEIKVEESATPKSSIGKTGKKATATAPAGGTTAAPTAGGEATAKPAATTAKTTAKPAPTAPKKRK